MILPYDKALKANSRALRSNLTDAEQKLWQGLRRKQINGWQFYRQKPIGPYIVDFYCAAARLVVELDGSQHFEAQHREADQNRDEYLRSLGLTVLRFDNRQVLAETEAVLEVIRRIPPSPPFSKGGDNATDLSSIPSSVDNHAYPLATNQASPLPTEETQNPVPPFEKGGLGGIKQNHSPTNDQPKNEDSIDKYTGWE
ncbi:endonuclease domain-containing protein [Methylomarinum sp. Ch1-1]|uniref:Endonuclease domain-containing protein n=1 Tax=Methylomarinum roseum TaxID=3067653 RepID=A0AAU7NUL7_9GAMM